MSETAHLAQMFDSTVVRVQVFEISETSRFNCPNCQAEYKLVRAEGDPPPDRQIVCRRCGGPFQGREGKFILKYFLVDRPRTQAKAPRGG